MPFPFTRHAENPIVTPGLYDWRRATVFNPGVVYDDAAGKFYLYERAAGSLRPFHCSIGLQESDDGVHFQLVQDTPVLTPADLGSEYGSVQDPRVVRIDGTYYMTYAFRPFAWSSHPTGVGVPESHESDFPGVVRAEPETGGSTNVQGARPDNNTRSGVASSTDGRTWHHRAWVTPPEIDDRNAILFPEKINGQFALLRRPLHLVGPQYGTDYPSIWIVFSPDLVHWGEPQLLAKPQFGWEDNRIGGACPPIRTPEGWLLLYHAVQTLDARTRRVCYRQGGMILDADDPTKVIARAPDFLMEPEAYYERFGLYIPNVIFPTGGVVRDGLLHLYYGVCDTAIALATAPLDELVAHILRTGRI